MPWRDLLNDTPALEFVSDFSPRPLTDRASSFYWCFAREGGNLTPLLG